MPATRHGCLPPAYFTYRACAGSAASPGVPLVFHNPDPENYVEGPGLVRLDDGSLVAVVPVVPREGMEPGKAGDAKPHSHPDQPRWRAELDAGVGASLLLRCAWVTSRRVVPLCE